MRDALSVRLTSWRDPTAMVDDDDNLNTAVGCIRSSLLLALISIGVAGFVIYLAVV
ncbi:MAG: hypothetical protein AAGB25_06165 [Pseudomonadota bacterium]